MSIKLKILLALVITSNLGLGLSFYFLYKEQIQKNELEMISKTASTGESRSLKVESGFTNIAGKIRNKIGQVKDADQVKDLPQETLIVSPTILASWVYEDKEGQFKFISEATKEERYNEIFRPILEKEVFADGLEATVASPLRLVEVDGQYYGLHVGRIRGKSTYYLYNLLNLDDIFDSLEKDGLFRNYLVKKDGTIVFNAGKIGKEEVSGFLTQNVLSRLNSGQTGGFSKKVNYGGQPQTFNVSKISVPQMFLVTLADSSKFSQPLILFFVKSGLVLISTICLAIIIAILTSNRISGPLRLLTSATQTVAAGNFDVDLNIKSKDEIGALASNFTVMSDKIGQLLDELREYNEHLEDMVNQRTQELREALDLNQTMMNSVSQGFLMFDRELKVLPTYSKAAEIILEKDLKETTMLNVLKEQDKDGNLQEFLGLVFEETFPFEDLIDEVPSKLHMHDDKYVELDYYPVRDEEEKLKFVVSIATDKTTELKYQRELEQQSAFVQMALKATNDRKRFVGFISNTKQSVEKIIETPDNYTGEEIFRFVHTLKGNSGIYHMKQVHEICADFEEHIKACGENVWDEEGKSKEYITNLRDALYKVIVDTSSIVGVSPETLKKDLVVSPDRMEKRLEYLKNAGKEKEFHELDLLMNYALVNEEITGIESMIAEVAEKVGKPMPVLGFDGPEVYMRDEQWLVLSEQLVHLIRNSMDHGIESAEERVEAGKPEAGNINISWGELEDSFFLALKDDGRGINVDGLKKKLFSLDLVKEEEFDESKVGEYLFFDRVTTKDTVSDISGQGVGLASVKQIIEDMGGKIEVAYKAGMGTMFTISFPVRNRNIVRQEKAA